MPVNKSFDSIFSAVQKSFPQKKDKTKKSYEIEGLLKPTMKDGKFNIVFFETEKRNLKIHTTHDTFICTDSIGYVEKLLSSKGFFRTHRSYLVNLSMVRSYDKEDITMVNNETAMVSARKYRVFKQKYLDWKFEHASF